MVGQARVHFYRLLADPVGTVARRSTGRRSPATGVGAADPRHQKPDADANDERDDYGKRQADRTRRRPHWDDGTFATHFANVDTTGAHSMT